MVESDTGLVSRAPTEVCCPVPRHGRLGPPMGTLACPFPSLLTDMTAVEGHPQLHFYCVFLVFRKKLSRFQRLAEMNLMRLISFWDL